jgi:glycosyltransferase involved in cell wall biosynthesis
MRIAMIAPLMESVPPPQYGGTERVVSVLTETLVMRGHHVTLFASGDSITRADLVACCPSALRTMSDKYDHLPYTTAQLGEVYRRAGEFDVIHNHNDYYVFPAARLTRTPTVSTTHGRLDTPEAIHVHEAFGEQPLVSISDSQRAPLPNANWVGTVYNGIDVANFHFRRDPGDYLVFLGRISPEKRPDRAIEIARDVGIRLVIAAKIDAADRSYYDHAIKRLIDSSSLIEFVGEVNEQEKDELLGGAYAYLFPIDWPEPFGLTVVEAMATGTPVIASPVGSVPEIVVDGVTGFLRKTLHGMTEAVEHIGTLDRAACRAYVERYFSPDAMADGYEAAYRRVIDQAEEPRQPWITFPSPRLATGIELGTHDSLS